MADARAIRRVQKAIKASPLGADLKKRVIERADEATTAALPKRKTKDFLHESRKALRRLQALGLVWRLGERRSRYLKRAKAELAAICGFADWNPGHFLDTAEMTHAVAIGYDWFHKELNRGERKACIDAIVDKGLRPGLAQLTGTPKPLWPAQSTNWNIVCNAGLMIGALAVGDERDKEVRKLAREVFARCLNSIPTGFDGYSPDGSWDEGPGYWAYATEYSAYVISALKTALNEEYGLPQLPGFRETGRFRMYAEGSAVAQDQTGLFFNYSDCDEERPGSWCMRWLAHRFKQPTYNAVALKNGQSRPMDLLWFSPKKPPDSETVPRNKLFRGIANVAMMRGSWDRKKAAAGFQPWKHEHTGDVYVGIRAGTNSRENSHGQLDLGSFVLDSQGVRWATDIPPIAGDEEGKYGGDYDLPGYFDVALERRFRYYRTGTFGHNTLVINGFNQPLGVWTEIVGFRDQSPKLVVAVVDLTAAYPDCLRARRGFALIDGKHVLIVDELTPKKDMTVAWQMHTRATVLPDDTPAKRVELNHEVTGGKGPERFFVQLLEPSDARFSVECAIAAQPKEAPNPGVCKLVATINRAEPTRIAVYLSANPKPVRLPPPLAKPLWAWLDWAGETRRAEKELRWKQEVSKLPKR